MARSLSPQSSSRSTSQRRKASTACTDFVKKQYPTKVPIVAITAICKLFGKKEPLSGDAKLVKRLSQSATHMNTVRFIEYLSTDTHYQKGKRLEEDHLKRIYQGNCNPQGKLSFQYLMKMAKNNGVALTEKTAKAIVRKYGKGKNFLNIEDCNRILHNRYEKIGLPVSPPKNDVKKAVSTIKRRF